MFDFNRYQEAATKTFKEHQPLNPHQARLLDWTVGLSGEVGEVSELVKHYVFHKEQTNPIELAKEIGDVLWYLSAICATTGIPLEACADLNIAKLQHRHGGNYSHSTSAGRHEQEAKFTDTDIYKTIVGQIMASIEKNQNGGI